MLVAPLYVAMLESSGAFGDPHRMFSPSRFGGHPDAFLQSAGAFPLAVASTSASPSPVAFFPPTLVSSGTPSPVPLGHHVRLPTPLHPTSILPPPPYSSATLFAMHNTPTIQFQEPDVDVVGLTEEANEVTINDDEDEPLDLSVKRCEPSPSSSSSTPRPSVIISGGSPSVRHTPNVRRSASSVTPREEPDVSEHFRRSLSGKWPRRMHHEGERSSPFRRKPSMSTTSLVPNAPTSTATSSQIIVHHSGSEIEEHFRKALGDKSYEEWKKSKEKSASSRSPS